MTDSTDCPQPPVYTANSARRPTVALGVTGSIAAFKAIEIARLLTKKGVRVLPVLTRSGARFVGPITFTGICGERVRTDMWDETFAGELHVHLATEADVVLIAPATADILARIASGRADDLLAALALCARGSVIAAPAMHPRMWVHPATQRSVRTIQNDSRVLLVGPVEGLVANGEVGMGRMAEPSDIVEEVMACFVSQDLCAKHIVVTAGPTVEDIDPVRFLGNRSTGRMGFAIARNAAARGARVTLIAGPTELATPLGVNRVNVRSALQMRDAVHMALGQSLQSADVLVMAAAVGDYRPAEAREVKLKRGADPIAIHFVPNPDILAEIGHQRSGPRPVLVGFALESEREGLEQRASEKLAAKRVDLVVGNTTSDGLGGSSNVAVIADRDGVVPLPRMTKDALAGTIVDQVCGLLSSRGN